jgi:hypothetical protein
MPKLDHRRALLSAAVVAVIVATAWPGTARSEQKYPDVVGVEVRPRGPTTFDFDVTLSSPYDTAARYADAFRVETTDGRVLGERTLWHDHADEQPFTRDLYGVTIPAGIALVVVRGRDKAHGWGGKTREVRLPGR